MPTATTSPAERDLHKLIEVIRRSPPSPGRSWALWVLTGKRPARGPAPPPSCVVK